MRVLTFAVDAAVMLMMSIYFTVGYVLVFLPIYLFVFPFRRTRERNFQRVTSWYYAGLVNLARGLMPAARIRVSLEVRAIRSAVVVCNHLSYLDTLLMLATFRRQKTFVKPSWFRAPFFGWVMKHAGYIPPAANPKLAEMMLARLDDLPDFFAAGGNLFIFPEGTRSRDGRLGGFEPGAFKLARRVGVPIELLIVKNSEQLFAPGTFFWRTCRRTTVSLERLARIEAAEVSGAESVEALVAKARARYLAA